MEFGACGYFGSFGLGRSFFWGGDGWGLVMLVPPTLEIDFVIHYVVRARALSGLEQYGEIFLSLKTEASI